MCPASLYKLDAQVINRAKLLRAGKDNLFVKLLFAKEKPVIPQNEREQQIIGKRQLTACYPRTLACVASAMTSQENGAFATGWHRMVLLVSYFSPDQLRDPSNFDVLKDQLIVAPVTQTLVFSKVWPVRF